LRVPACRQAGCRGHFLAASRGFKNARVTRKNQHSLENRQGHWVRKYPVDLIKIYATIIGLYAKYK